MKQIWKKASIKKLQQRYRDQIKTWTQPNVVIIKDKKALVEARKMIEAWYAFTFPCSLHMRVT